jgi:hypothetical protein
VFDHSPRARGVGLCLSAVFSALALGLSGQAWATAPYIPDGSEWPTITLNEGQEGAPGLAPLRVPPPRGVNENSIWNMEIVGFNDNQGRTSFDDGWLENQDGRYILYVANGGGKADDPLTGVKGECSGVSLIDVTNPRHPVYLYNLVPTTCAGRSHIAVCSGSLLAQSPTAIANGSLPSEAGHWYLVTHDGSLQHEVWDVSNPSKPFRVSVILSNITTIHHEWWECDTGIAWTIAQLGPSGAPVGSPYKTSIGTAGVAADGWWESSSAQHEYIWNIANPANPVFIRQFGLPGQQPMSAAMQAAQTSCLTAPSSNCYVGVVSPPGGVHELYSAGQIKNRIYVAYGVNENGIDAIYARDKMIYGCTTSGSTGSNPSASANCANQPTQADLFWPMISYFTQNPQNGGHTLVPIYGVPIPEMQENFLGGGPITWDLMINASEDTTNDCFGQTWKNPMIIDITNELTPVPISTPNVGQFPGNFCARGWRFGTHTPNREIYPPYYGRLLIFAMFNAGTQIWDIRDPLNPRRVAYFIQAPNANSQIGCGTYQGNTNYCRAYTYNDMTEVDDRGYLYHMDRSGSGVTILKLTGDALEVVTGQRDRDRDRDDDDNR